MIRLRRLREELLDEREQRLADWELALDERAELLDRVLEDMAARIEARAQGASHLARYPDQTRLCADAEGHDDRWCGACAAMEAGMELAAAMVRGMTDRWGRLEGNDDDDV